MLGMDNMAKILIIDDDPDLCALVGTVLNRDGYEVDVAYDGHAGLEKVQAFKPDLILLDVMMPGGSGWDVCEQLREAGNAPIIFLSARGSESDIVRGLNLGADDYISKPFRRHEMVARIEAVLRRAKSGAVEGNDVFQVGDLVIDQTRWEVLRGEDPVHLTPTEFRLLLLLAQNPGRPVTHHDILTTVWGDEHKDNLNLLKVYIRQLRQKLERNPDQPQYLFTKRGVGYFLAP